MTSSAISAKPTPPMLETVPGKHASITSAPSPSDSKIWAPQYEDSVEMPIFDSTLRRPSSAAAQNFRRASSGVGRGGDASVPLAFSSANRACTDGRAVGPGSAVAQDEDASALPDSAPCGAAQPVERGAEPPPVRPGLRVPGR